MEKFNLQLTSLKILLILVMITGSVLASETRAISMGATGIFIRDNSNVTQFPGTLLSYNNQMFTELRLKDTQTRFTGGIHLPVLNTGYTAGVHINRPVIPVDPFGISPNTTVNRVSDIVFGMKMGNNDLGFRLSYGADSFTQDSTAGQPEIDESGRYIEVGVGLSNKQFDVGVTLALPGVDNETGQAKSEFSGTGIGLNGRYFHKLTSKMHVVPVMLFYTLSGTQETDPGGGATKSEADLSEMLLDIAAALHYQVDEETLVLLGLGLYTSHSTNVEVKDGPETTQTYTSMPVIYIGGETRISSWLYGRMGAYQNFETSTTTIKPHNGDETESSSTTSYLNFTFGLGAEVGNFLIDLDINHGSFFEGTYLLGGRARDIFNRVSVTYNFER